jgi:hypothetical protein
MFICWDNMAATTTTTLAPWLVRIATKVVSGTDGAGRGPP